MFSQAERKISFETDLIDAKLGGENKSEANMIIIIIVIYHFVIRKPINI